MMDNELSDISTSLAKQFFYGAGHVLNDVCASLWFTYFLVFFHLVLEFSPSQAGQLLLIGQVVDGLATPFVGYHSDHTDNAFSAKYGKRKLWHLFGIVCILLSFPFVFSECVGCSTSDRWAQMVYYAAFIGIFQIGWASVQISHLSLIPELSDSDETRTHLTAIRFGFTVFSNILVYLLTWVVLRATGDCDNQQIGPGDAWKFRLIVYTVLGIGAVATVVFHVGLKERTSYVALRESEAGQPGTHSTLLRRPALYQVALIYMSTRVVVNVSQVLVTLYLHKTLSLPAKALAVVPLSMYLGSLAAAGAQRTAPKGLSRKLHYTFGAVFALVAFIWIYLDESQTYKTYLIYIVAVFIGFGGSVMLVTSLALTADLVGAQTHAAAFVYGLMSFADKLGCGLVIVAIQQYAEGSNDEYYRLVLASVCGGATLLGTLATLALPPLQVRSPPLLDDAGAPTHETETLGNDR